MERAALTGLRIEESSLDRRPMTDAAWTDVLDRVGSVVRNGDRRLALTIVSRIDGAIARLDPIMNRYCELTCPACTDPCCNGKRIFFNRADLLVLTVRNAGLPPGQTRSVDGEPCRYLAADGCALERTHRPYVCVWFLCEPQMVLLHGETARFQREFLRDLGEIREGRLALESLFKEESGS